MPFSQNPFADADSFVPEVPEDVIEPTVNDDNSNDNSNYDGNLDADYASHTSNPVEPDLTGNPTPNPQQAGDKEQVRYQHWQSKYAKAEAQLKAMEGYMPLIQHINQNPELLQQLAQSMQKGQQGIVAPETLQKPQRPQKPQSFSIIEAQTDPESQSAKYLMDERAYQESLLEYTEKYSERIQQEEQYKRQQEQQIMQNRIATNNLYRELIGDYKLTPQEAQKFIQKFSSPESLDLPNMIGYFKYMEGGQKQQPVRRQNIPMPPSGIGTTQQAPIDDNSMFNQSMKQAYSKNKIDRL